MNFVQTEMMEPFTLDNPVSSLLKERLLTAISAPSHIEAVF